VKILVVDDTPDVRQIHARFLHGSGMEVFTAENGTVALYAARHAIPDVVVTDIDMPLMNGLDLCRHLRSDPATRDVVVVVVTGNVSDKGQAALEAGCDAVLGKPCSRTLLVSTIQALVERR